MLKIENIKLEKGNLLHAKLKDGNIIHGIIEEVENYSFKIADDLTLRKSNIIVINNEEIAEIYHYFK